MRYLLDTNTCIDYLRYPSSKVRARIQSCSPQEIALCTIVQAELYYGAWRSRNPSHNFELLEEFFQPFVSLPFCLQAARVYGETCRLTLRPPHSDFSSGGAVGADAHA